MHLLNAKTLKLETFLDRAKTPAYAILSHTWGDEEVLYDDVKNQSRSDYSARNGFAKIQYSCQQAIEDGLDYVWIDTTCIDKKSSSELSEAINSMFAWYREAKVCYAYLDDVSVISEESGVLIAPKLPPSTIMSFDVADLSLQSRQFVSSRWFTRGWTLQELLAPNHIIFFDRSWINLGSLHKPTAKYDDLAAQLTRPEADLASLISHATRIPIRIVAKREDFRRSSLAKRLSWAASRQTTREEDEAYCLLGIFDVNMSLLYGEGPRAFQRLQREVAKCSNDHTLFAWVRTQDWEHNLSYETRVGPDDYMLFAPSLDRFHSCHYLGRKTQISLIGGSMDTMPYDVMKSGIEITLPLHYCVGSPGEAIAVLQCFDERRAHDSIYLVLDSDPNRSPGPQRAFDLTHPVKTAADIRFIPRVVHITDCANNIQPSHERLYLKFDATKDLTIKATQVFPEAVWDDSTSSCNLTPRERRLAILDITRSTDVEDPFSTIMPQQSYQIYIVVEVPHHGEPYSLGIGPYQDQDLAALCVEAKVEYHRSSWIHPVAEHLFVEVEVLQYALQQPPILAINIAQGNLKFAKWLSRAQLVWDLSMLLVRHPLRTTRVSIHLPMGIVWRIRSWLWRKAHRKSPNIVYRSGLVASQHHENPTGAKKKPKRLIVEEWNGGIEEFKRLPHWLI